MIKVRRRRKNFIETFDVYMFEAQNVTQAVFI